MADLTSVTQSEILDRRCCPFSPMLDLIGVDLISSTNNRTAAASGMGNGGMSFSSGTHAGILEAATAKDVSTGL